MGLLKVLEFTLDKFESFVGVNFWTMIFAWVNLLILYLLFKKFLFAPIKNMIDSRQKEIDDMYSDADNARKSAKQLQTEYEEKLNHAEAESEQILKNAVRRAQLKEEEILKEADRQAERTMERAHEQIALEKKQAINDVKDQVGAMAIGIASAVIERDVSEDEHKKLIDDFIGKMGNDE